MSGIIIKYCVKVLQGLNKFKLFPHTPSKNQWRPSNLRPTLSYPIVESLLSTDRRPSRCSCAARMGLAGSSIIISQWLDVQQLRSSCILRSRCHHHAQVGRLLPWQKSMHLDACSLLIRLKRGALGRHPHCGACLFPGLHSCIGVPHHPLGPLSQRSSQHVSSLGMTS